VSIIELQARARRLGEIRLGDKAPSGYPVSLDTFRLTSAAKGLLDQAAVLWGGEVQPWDTKWQIVTEATELPVIVPPQDPDNITWYELWSQGGLQRRCDGDTMQDGDPCKCDPDNRECSMVTRLSLMLPDMPDVGIWTLSSTGYYAASEMAMSIKLVMQAAQKTGMLPEATLAIDHREIKRPSQPLKKFVVPILRFADTLGSFIDVDGGVALPSPESPRHLPGGDAAGVGVSGTVQPQPEPLPAAQGNAAEFDELMEDLEAEVVDDEPLAEVVDHPTVDQAWTELLDILSEKPDDGSMGNVQDRVYRLYTFMHRAGMWTEGARVAALEQHYGTEHLTGLRKAELNEFAVKSFDAAKAAVTEGEDDG
jgi:hypothetical protein